MGEVGVRHSSCVSALSDILSGIDLRLLLHKRMVLVSTAIKRGRLYVLPASTLYSDILEMLVTQTAIK
jgi:hypothetical protein